MTINHKYDIKLKVADSSAVHLLMRTVHLNLGTRLVENDECPHSRDTYKTNRKRHQTSTSHLQRRIHFIMSSIAVPKDRLRTEKANPRGIPEAKFIENVKDLLPGAVTDADVELLLNELQVRLQQYRLMEQSKTETLANLRVKIPDITKTLEMCQFLKTQEEPIEANYELNDTLYSRAEIQPTKTVYLWLGANTMLEYPIDEAIELLDKRLKLANENKKITLDDLEYLRSNITTIEVNTARVYNWDVQRKRDLKKSGAVAA
ncbi:unnamed protein product [Ambrosiozyma monospora]|uniref:Unnamed protein product n=1 Tax=Ambrosiozyma monospora TaxID=43982 RepID=A0A9W7DCM4_AMBMO|nr:unnamed protein product [Ambrosiozyma monospora]